MTDTYRDFRALRAAEREGEDWAVECRERGSRILVMAPHGGWIEPLTTELAREVAGSDFSFYSFLGLKSEGNAALHLTSHRFDEPLALALSARVQRVVAIHGERSRRGAFVMVGGRWAMGVDALTLALEGAGFEVRDPRPGLGGRHPRNICNRGRSGAGGQLEISEGLRGQLREDPARREGFVEAVRSTLLEFETDRVREGEGGNRREGRSRTGSRGVRKRGGGER